MLHAIRLGTDDISRSQAFYDATFDALGIGPGTTMEGFPMVMWKLGATAFIMGTPRNGEPASPANGGTIIFAAPNAQAVHEWHARGLALGGSCEGAPGPRDFAGNAVGAYIRDPDGNKIAAYFGLSI